VAKRQREDTKLKLVVELLLMYEGDGGGLSLKRKNLARLEGRRNTLSWEKRRPGD
jgi:hypothetical protein